MNTALPNQFNALEIRGADYKILMCLSKSLGYFEKIMSCGVYINLVDFQIFWPFKIMISCSDENTEFHQNKLMKKVTATVKIAII